MKQPRALQKEEISCRVQQVTDSKGAIILLYKDARVDMNILDDTYGPMNWQRRHEVINGNLFCTISIWDENKGEWISKQDVGVESYTEATKGEASDAFKRSGFNWGIGRELYTAPFIFVQLTDAETYLNKNGKQAAKASFALHVSDLEYNEKREITMLVLKDKQGKVRFSHGAASRIAPLAAVESNGSQAVKVQRMKQIAQDVRKYAKTSDKAKIRFEIDAAEAWMKSKGRYVDAPYEAMNALEFAEYLKALYDFYHPEQIGQEAAV